MIRVDDRSPKQSNLKVQIIYKYSQEVFTVGWLVGNPNLQKKPYMKLTVHGINELKCQK